MSFWESGLKNDIAQHFSSGEAPSFSLAFDSSDDHVCGSERVAENFHVAQFSNF
jgi:hypothetical protein